LTSAIITEELVGKRRSPK